MTYSALIRPPIKLLSLLREGCLGSAEAGEGNAAAEHPTQNE